jgi:LPPG:FO 2-phospho-L-lactate transferase
MMAEKDMMVSATTVAAYYGDLIDGFVMDSRDKGQEHELACAPLVTDTVMRDAAGRRRLAQEMLRFAIQLSA